MPHHPGLGDHSSDCPVRRRQNLRTLLANHRRKNTQAPTTAANTGASNWNSRPPALGSMYANALAGKVIKTAASATCLRLLLKYIEGGTGWIGFDRIDGDPQERTRRCQAMDASRRV